MLLCEDGSLYTGITNNLENRLTAHQKGTGAKYTLSHKPIKIVYSQPFPDRSQASIREAQLKKLSRSQKQALFQ